MKFKRIALIIALMLLTVLVLTGCGAEVNTTMRMTTEFSGQRMIDVVIDNDDTSKITGGIEALKQVAQTNLPAEMTFSYVAGESDHTLTFVITFTSLDDYKTKVNSLVTLGGNTEIVPEIEYSFMNTVFKKGVKFEENFTSFELLRWFYNAVDTAGIVTESQSNWYEMGDSTVIIGEETYDSYDELEVDKQELCCLDDIEVSTVLNIDGTFEREIVFSAYDETVEDLADKSCNLSSYLSKLAIADEGDVFTEDPLNEENNRNNYTIKITAKDAEELVKKTDRILQTKNGFAFEITADEENKGMARLKVTEKLDGTYYLDYDSYDRIDSKITLFDNCTLIENEDDKYSSVSFYEKTLSYSSRDFEEYVFEADWKISFASVEIVLDVKGKEDIAVDFVFTLEEALKEELKSSAIAALKEACGDHGKFKEDGGVSKITFSGKIDETVAAIDNFVKANDPSYAEGMSYFSIIFKESETPSKFTKGYVGEIGFNLRPIVGETKILFNDVNGSMADYYYQGSFEIDEDGNRLLASQDVVEFTLIKVNLVSIILLVVFALIFVAGIILLLANLKKIVSLINEIKERKKAAAAAAAAQQAQINAAQPVDNTQYTQPVADASAPVAPVVPQNNAGNVPPPQVQEENNGTEDEEELL